MNEVRITGHVTNAFIDNNGHLCCTIVCTHSHMVDGYDAVSQTYIRCDMLDKEASKAADIHEGDDVFIIGHLKLDIKYNSSGNYKRKVNLYIDHIEKECKHGKYA